MNSVLYVQTFLDIVKGIVVISPAHVNFITESSI